MTKTAEALKDWVIEALGALGGSARVPQIAKHIWDSHEQELRSSGDLFYTWQYAMRRAGQVLQQERRISKKGPGRPWQLV